MPSDKDNSHRRENKVSAARIPETLIEYDRWICWRYEQIEDREQKPPYDPSTGEYASIHKPKTWADFETALDQYRKGNYDGIGFVLTADDPFTGFDFDDCRNPTTGEIKQEVENIIRRLDSFSEISPSGSGIHTIIRGEKPDQYGSEGGDHIEVYDSARYLTVTGKHLDETPETIQNRSAELQRICEIYLTEQPQREPDQGFDTPKIAEGDNGYIEIGKEALHNLQEESTPAFNSVMNFLQGGIADFDPHRLTKENGDIDRSSQEFIGISLLYSALERYLYETGHPLKEITWALWTHYCQNHPKTEDNQRRRWINDSADYRKQIFNNALSTADAEKFETIVENKGAGTRRENDEYSRMTFSALWNSLFEQIPGFDEIENLLASSPHLYNDMDPANPATEPGEPDGHAQAIHDAYPNKEEIINRAYEIDKGYNEWNSYEEAFRRLQSDYGEVSAARVGSSTWVYYPPYYPDPPEASYVLLKGEQREPEEPDSMWMPVESSPEQEVMTDGGVQTGNSEARQEIDQINDARERSNSPEDQTLLACPVDDCSKMFIEEGALRNHVSQSDDALHRHRTLDDNLEVEMVWREMDWGPGAPV